MRVDATGIDTSVVIIGAGQAGLSVAYYLRRLGLDPGNEFVMLDRGPGTGGAWQALRLGHAHRVNDLPGMEELGVSFDTADRQLPAKEVVADFYARYEEHYDLQVVRPADVTRVEPLLDGFAVTFEGPYGVRRVTTSVIVNATGTWGSPFVPWYPGMNDFAGRHLHTVDYTDAEEFRDRAVVVVGGGTSAIGFVMELENVAGQVVWVARRPIEFLEEQELNIENGVTAVALQDDAARDGRALPSIVSTTGVPRSRRIQAAIDRGLLVARPMFASIEADGVRWANGAFQRADAIIWSTGFRPELRHLSPLKLREKAGGKVEVSVPQRGDRRRLIEQAQRNAMEALERRMAESGTKARLGRELAEFLELPEVPQRIEIYDNSHIQGAQALGAMVVAGPEGFIKGQYRKWNIKTAQTNDDFAMMREVMTRRFGRAQDDDPDRYSGMWPDLVLIDGGKGQMSAVKEALGELGIEDVPLIAIAKGPGHGREGREVFHFADGREKMLPENAPLLFHLQRLRDEVHRFAIGAHREKRSRAITASPLDEVPGIGPARKRALLLHFGTASRVRAASLKDLQCAPGVSAAVAQSVYDFYHVAG